MLKSGYEDILLGTRELRGQNQSHTLSWKKRLLASFLELPGRRLVLDEEQSQGSLCVSGEAPELHHLVGDAWMTIKAST